jgi:hypothetical protein
MGTVRLRIVSDGAGRTTRIENADTGELVEGVTAVRWGIDHPGSMAHASVAFARIAVDVIGEARDFGAQSGEQSVTTATEPGEQSDETAPRAEGA